MDDAFGEIVEDGDLLLTEDYMMNVFKSLATKIPPFEEYLTYMFDSKQSSPVGSRKLEDKILPWGVLRDELFHPTRSDIVQSNSVSAELAVHGAARFCVEFRDETKATANYVAVINGKKCMNNVTDEERVASRGVDASNSISLRVCMLHQRWGYSLLPR